MKRAALNMAGAALVLYVGLCTLFATVQFYQAATVFAHGFAQMQAYKNEYMRK